MGVTNSNKVISTDQIACDGSLRVTLALTAAPDIMSNPTDIVLVLDRSGSMTGLPLASMKAGADTFIDIIDEATDGAADGQIGSGSRIGIVSFAGSATADTQLITSVADLKDAVDALTAGGNTNHADAFSTAAGLFDPASSHAKVIVMFTDGNTTAGPPSAPVADAAKAQGIIIYAIGLVGSDGVDVSALNEWATDPDAAHVAVTPDAADLEQLFADLAANISNPGATDIVIDEVVNPDFVITSVLMPTKGSAAVTGLNSLRWTIPELGVTASESAVLEFFIRHTAQTSGVKEVNQSIDYSDAEGNAVTFPDPTVTVSCDVVVCPEGCPDPVDLSVEGCADAVVVDAGDVYLESQGPDHPAERHPQKRLPRQAGGPGRHPHGGGRQRPGVLPGPEDLDHPRPRLPLLPGRPCPVHQIRGARGSERLLRRGQGHVLPAQLPGPVHRPHHRHQLPMLPGLLKRRALRIP